MTKVQNDLPAVELEDMEDYERACDECDGR